RSKDQATGCGSMSILYRSTSGPEPPSTRPSRHSRRAAAVGRPNTKPPITTQPADHRTRQLGNFTSAHLGRFDPALTPAPPPLPAAVRLPWATNRRHVNSRFWRNAVLPSYQANRHPQREGLLDHSNLLGHDPTPAAVNRRNDLNAIRRVGHRHGWGRCKSRSH